MKLFLRGYDQFVARLHPDTGLPLRQRAAIAIAMRTVDFHGTSVAQRDSRVWDALSSLWLTTEKRAHTGRVTDIPL